MLKIQIESDPILLLRNYIGKVIENSPPGTFVLNVAAFTNNGTSKNIVYAIEENQSSENFKVIRTK